jgi:hypothetical protein
MAGEHLERPRIDAASKVHEVLARYPGIGLLMIEQGALFSAPPGQMSPSYPDLTIEEYAARHALDLQPLVRRLNAEAEALELQASDSAGAHEAKTHAGTRSFDGLIGYTGGYREPASPGLESASVVAVQSARGP